jgi:hypothetical protein
MINAVNSWVAANPFWTFVISTVFGGLIAAWVTLAWPTIETFSALPPQRLNIRMLKARINGLETKLDRLNDLVNNTDDLTYQCFLALLMWQFGIHIVFLTAIGLCAPPSESKSMDLIVAPSFECLSVVIFYLAIGRTREIVDSIDSPNSTRKNMAERLDKLKAKLTAMTSH